MGTCGINSSSDGSENTFPPASRGKSSAPAGARGFSNLSRTRARVTFRETTTKYSSQATPVYSADQLFLEIRKLARAFQFAKSWEAAGGPTLIEGPIVPNPAEQLGEDDAELVRQGAANPVRVLRARINLLAHPFPRTSLGINARVDRKVAAGLMRENPGLPEDVHIQPRATEVG